MLHVWPIVALINVTVVAVLVGMIQWGRWRIKCLDHVPYANPAEWPAVSLVVAARNEARNIEAAVHSWLQLDYEALEIIVIDDRSDDATPEILQRFCTSSDRLRVVRIDELPPNWLGKNHALFVGAEAARGKYVLFTDADVVLGPDVVRNAVAYCETHQFDHLTLAPRAVVPSLLLNAFVVFFTNMFLLYTRPWRVANPRSRTFVGIGAFNLIRRAAYYESGTHQAIAMRPDDDVKLGKIIKHHGFRQQMLDGGGKVVVPWYESLDELIRGMEKNAFSGVNYSVAAVLLITTLLLVFDLWPFAAVCLLRGPAQWIYGVGIGLLCGNVWFTAYQSRITPWVVLCWPCAVLLLIYIQWRAMILTYRQGGIRWRGTLYSLEELRRNQV